MPPGVPTIAAATAHPAKFPDAMERATGPRPPLPPRLADLYEREERFTRAPDDLAAVEAPSAPSSEGTLHEHDAIRVTAGTPAAVPTRSASPACRPA